MEICKQFILEFSSHVSFVFALTIVGFVTLRLGNFIQIFGLSDLVVLLTQGVIFMAIFSCLCVWLVNSIVVSE